MALPTDVRDVATLLEGMIGERSERVEVCHDYYNGSHDLRFATLKYREAFGRLLNTLTDNWCQIVVDASVERLRVDGFRFGQDQDADDEAWMLWQANALDADAALAHTEAGTSGVAYVLVVPGDDPETPRISIESPLEAITVHAPDDRRKRTAGLKRWLEDDGTVSAVVYLPDVFCRLEKANTNADWSIVKTTRNVTGAVPLVPMLNNPQLLGFGVSDLNVVMPLQDAVNKLLADMIVNSEFVAFPQRWATGIEIPRDEDGRALDREAFLSAVSRLWVAEEEGAKFGELAGSDGLGYVRNIEVLIQHIAAQTRTPPHYLLGQSGNFPSGESLKATETGLVAKVKRKQITFGETWEEAMRIAFAYKGDDMRSNAFDAEVIWSDPESRSQGELVDALLKMRELSVPLEALWARWGASPQEIERWKTLSGLPQRPDPGATAGGTTNSDATGSNTDSAPPGAGNRNLPF
jgi:hypothetical protein